MRLKKKRPEIDFWRHTPEPKTFLKYFMRLKSRFRETIRQKIAEGGQCVLYGGKEIPPFTITCKTPSVTVRKQRVGQPSYKRKPRKPVDYVRLMDERVTIHEFESKIPLPVIQTLRQKLGQARSRDDKRRFRGLTLRQLLQVYLNQRGDCAITGLRMEVDTIELTCHGRRYRPNAPSIDRVLAEHDGYEKDQVQLTCAWVNFAKNIWSNDVTRRMILAATWPVLQPNPNLKIPDDVIGLIDRVVDELLHRGEDDGKSSRLWDGLTRDDVLDMLRDQNGRCFVTGINLLTVEPEPPWSADNATYRRSPYNLTLTRLDRSVMEYRKTNVRVVCRWAVRMRGSSSWLVVKNYLAQAQMRMRTGTEVAAHEKTADNDEKTEMNTDGKTQADALVKTKTQMRMEREAAALRDKQNTDNRINESLGSGDKMEDDIVLEVAGAIDQR